MDQYVKEIQAYKIGDALTLKNVIKNGKMEKQSLSKSIWFDRETQINPFLFIVISILFYNITRSILYMRSGYQPPYDKRYFHTKKNRKKRHGSRKEKNSVNPTKKKMFRYEERIIRG